MSGLPEGWASTRLGDLADFIMGQAPPGSACNFEGEGTPFVKAGEFGAERPIIREWTTKPLKMALSTDVLMCVVGATCGKLNLGADCAIGRSVAAIRPGPALDQHYLYALLKPLVTALRRGSTGSAQGVISKDHLAEIKAALPPLAEQQRIVVKLDALTARTARARADLDRIPALAQRCREAVLGQYFDAELGSPSLRLEEITPADAKIIYGILQPGPDTPGGVPYVRPTEIVDGQLELDAMRRTTSEIAQRYKRSTLAEGDVLLSIVGTIGKVAVVPPNMAGANITQSSCRIRPRADVLTPSYLRYFLLSPMATRQYDNARLGTAVPRLNLEDVRDIKIPLPAVAEQTGIVRRIDAAFAEIDRLTAEAAAARRLLDRLDQAILAKAFRGELVPQDPADEPASVLLYRIRAECAAAPKAKRGRPSRLGNNEVEAA